MPNPKRRHSKSRRDKRRANWKLDDINITECPQCHQPVMPHRACKSCGFYNNEIAVVTKDKSKKNKKQESEK